MKEKPFTKCNVSLIFETAWSVLLDRIGQNFGPVWPDLPDFDVQRKELCYRGIFLNLWTVMAGRTRFAAKGRQLDISSDKMWSRASTRTTFGITSSSEIRVDILNALDGQTCYPKELFSRIPDKWRSSYWNVSDALNSLVSEGLIAKTSDGFGTLFTTTDEGRAALKDGRLSRNPV